MNGKVYELKVKPKALLSDVLRKDLKLTGDEEGMSGEHLRRLHRDS